jgi:thiol:disulfide interchange protein DsbD
MLVPRAMVLALRARQALFCRMARALALLLCGWLLSPMAQAVESAAIVSPRATVTLVSEAAAIAPAQPFRVALRQRLAPGWHSYWLNPGDAGAPTELAFTLPAGWTASPLAFPAPRRIPFGPLVNFGFEGEASFLLTLTPPATLPPGESVTLEAEGRWLVCERICIPEEGRFALTLPVEAAPRPANRALFLAAEAALPQASPFPAEAAVAGGRALLTLSGAELTPRGVREAFFFPLETGWLDNAAPQPLRFQPGGFALSLSRTAGAAVPSPLEGVVMITDPAGLRSAFAISAPLAAMPAAPSPGLWQTLLFAALGGLILNLMPCVFPVLAMKALGLARLSGGARAEVRAHAASFSLGVVLSFVAIGGLLLGLRAAGSAAGWGFQFTSPGFVAAMAWVMLAVGLSLSGVFAMGRTIGAGANLAAHGGHIGSFFTGVLAVVVATPCTAPFMAGAIGAALALPAAMTLTVFAAMGLGMALPYALLGLFPGLAGRWPRPGPWMLRLREFLAFPMYGASAWLVWVLAQQSGADGVLLALAGGVLVALAAWALGLAQRGIAPRGARLGAIGAALLALALLPQLRPATAPGRLAAGQEPWSAARVAELQAAGRPVFVNLTAAWCISCKVNERLALDTAATQAAFAERHVAVLVGDWTHGDAAIGALLRAHGREGVPLYLLYPPGRGEPVILPQILTEGILRDGLERAIPAS